MKTLKSALLESRGSFIAIAALIAINIMGNMLTKKDIQLFVAQREIDDLTDQLNKK